MSYTNPTPAEVHARRALLAPTDAHNERVLLGLLAWRGFPERYLDLGSGTGAMVNVARRCGVSAWGVDVINGPEHWFVHHDLTLPLALGWRAPLITCFEVAEHLPANAAGVLCDTIAEHIERGGRLIFSAAPPGQAGEEHQNCQGAAYWRTLFYDRGIGYQAEDTRYLSLLLSLTAGPLGWLPANVQVFDA